jgi:hypothetical protein
MGEVVSLRRHSSQAQRPVTQVHVPLSPAMERELMAVCREGYTVPATCDSS